MSTQIKLTAENVWAVFRDCLFKDDEDTAQAVIAEGIMSKFGFHPERLAAHTGDIRSMLDCLSDDFQVSGGGGMSFLNACMTKDDNQWGEHQNMEQLLALGIAIGYARILLPRNMWSVLPGGVPYFSVGVSKKGNTPATAATVRRDVFPHCPL